MTLFVEFSKQNFCKYRKMCKSTKSGFRGILRPRLEVAKSRPQKGRCLQTCLSVYRKSPENPFIRSATFPRSCARGGWLRGFRGVKIRHFRNFTRNSRNSAKIPGNSLFFGKTISRNCASKISSIFLGKTQKIPVFL